MRPARTLLGLGTGALLGLAGCAAVMHDHHHPGPPPHAPAHGYRHRMGDVSYVYEAPLGAYVVVGHPHHYFLDGWYYRYVSGTWERCPQLAGRWTRVETRVVPAKLHAHYRGQRPEKVQVKGVAPAKRGKAPSDEEHEERASSEKPGRGKPRKARE